MQAIMLQAVLFAVSLSLSQAANCLAAPTEVTLHRFNPIHDGTNPEGVVLDSSGNIYGLTVSGGPSGYGTLFRFETNKTWRVLHSFTGASDGGYPGQLLITPSGVLDGIAAVSNSQCGQNNCALAFQFSTKGTEGILADLYNIGYFGPMTVDNANNLYPTEEGYLYPEGYQGIVSVLPAGGGPEKNVYAFEYDQTGTILTSLSWNNGYLYGTTQNGGGICDSCPGNGALFKLSTNGTIQLLYAFQGGYDGGDPNSIAFDQAGNIYGSTNSGGAYGLGTIFKYSSTGVKSILYSFAGGATDGSGPTSIVVGSTGVIYGVTTLGGSLANDYQGYGTVFEISPAGTEVILHAFKGPDGEYPNGIALNKAGAILGSTGAGGDAVGPHSGAGVLFEIQP